MLRGGTRLEALDSQLRVTVLCAPFLLHLSPLLPGNTARSQRLCLERKVFHPRAQRGAGVRSSAPGMWQWQQLEAQLGAEPLATLVGQGQMWSGLAVLLLASRHC